MTIRGYRIRCWPRSSSGRCCGRSSASAGAILLCRRCRACIMRHGRDRADAGLLARRCGSPARPSSSATLIAIVVGVPLGIADGALGDRRPHLPALGEPLPVARRSRALVPVIMVLFGLGQTTIILTVVLFAIWIIVLDARAGVRSHLAVAGGDGAELRRDAAGRPSPSIYVWAALPEILAGIRLGVIRAVKGVIIGQMLVSIVGFGELFELYSLALPDGAFLGGAACPLRLRLPARRGARLARAPGRLLRGEPRLNLIPTKSRPSMSYVVDRPPRQAALPVRGSSALFPVRRVYCVGRNYAEHAIEMGHDPNKEPPFFFQKNPDNLVPGGGEFPYPPRLERRASRDRAGRGAGEGRREHPGRAGARPRLRLCASAST